MLRATQRVNAIISSGKNSIQLQPLLDLICRFGSLADAEALFSLFIKYKQTDLLQPMMLLGNDDLAQQLFKQAVAKDQLNKTYPPDTLLALSYLRHRDTEAILVNYFKQAFALEWDLHKAICLGLLNYTCENYTSEILKVVEQCLNISLFPDFIPLLAIKIDHTEVIPQLIDHARNTASPACNRGILLTMALSGQAYREAFKSAIRFPGWSAPFYQHHEQLITLGMHYLNISLIEIYEDLILLLKNDQMYPYENVLGFAKLLQYKLNEPFFYPLRYIIKQDESFTSVYEVVFKPQNDNDSFIDHIERRIHNEHMFNQCRAFLNEIKELYELKIREEVAIDLYKLGYDFEQKE